MTASLFGDVAVKSAATPQTQRRSVAVGAWESFRRVTRDLEDGSRETPNRAGKYPYQVFHESLGKLSAANRDRLIALLCEMPANDLSEFTRALMRWDKLPDWERQNFAAAIGLNGMF